MLIYNKNFCCYDLENDAERSKIFTQLCYLNALVYLFRASLCKHTFALDKDALLYWGFGFKICIF